MADKEIRDIMGRTGITDVNRVIIIPGNQDVIRLKGKQCNPQGFDVYLDFMKKFYGDEYSKFGFTVASNNAVTTDIAKSRKERLEYILERPEWCIPTDKHVVFWPLYTASLNRQENSDGRLTDHEIRSGLLHIKKLRETDPDQICIVLAHHNFFPMGPDRKPRDEREASGAITYGCPENSLVRL